MKIAILGWGSQGVSAFDYWNTDDNEITICDSRDDLKTPDSIKTSLGADYLKGLDQYDLIVRAAPIIHPRDIISANSRDILSKVTSNTNEFLRICPTKNIIGVTGTKGKGTTSTLITKMLEAAGKTVHLGGNIGIPPLDLLKNDIKPDDWVVLELANFQLIDLKYSPMIAVCLMIVPEHLDWHEDMAEYKTAKQQLFVWQTFDDIAIYNAENEHSHTIAAAGNGTKLTYLADPGAIVSTDADGNKSISISGQTICRTDELKLLGEHNWENACAAVTAAWQVTHSASALRSVLTSFTGLPHRLEMVREVSGVKYYNDSFASGPDATIAALNAVTEPKVLIVGGYERNLPLDHLAAAFNDHAADLRKVLIIGQSGPRLAGVCDEAGFSNYSVLQEKDMTAILGLAQKEAQSGNAVLFSPGFASFDMFKNFEDRGDQYRQAVQKI